MELNWWKRGRTH